MLKLDVCSDLHVDSHFHATKLSVPEGEGPQSWKPGHHGERDFFQHVDWQWFKSPDSNILVIAGDISNKHSDVLDVLQDAADQYDLVLYTDGNHEHYDDAELDLRDNVKLLHQLTSKIPRVVYLDGIIRLTHRVDDCVFVGANGWYDWHCHERVGITQQMAISHWSTGNNDALYVRFGEDRNPERMAQIHSMHVAHAVAEANADPTVNHIVVFTHTAPREEVVRWDYDNHAWNLGTPSYVNTHMQAAVAADVNHKIRHWIFGHTHVRVQKMVDHVLYTNNSRGNILERRPMQMVQIEVAPQQPFVFGSVDDSQG